MKVNFDYDELADILHIRFKEGNTIVRDAENDDRVGILLLEGTEEVAGFIITDWKSFWKKVKKESK